MPFRYLRDPLFLACVGVYLVNRLVLKRVWEMGFFHESLNDLICLPFWVPVMLWVMRKVKLRRHDGPPEVMEVVIPLVVWAWVFEVILPATDWFGRYCVADERDILWYAVGAAGGWAWWRWWYGEEQANGVA
ncbi:MAG: hypothetical protein MUF18_15305 [Fimbriiglobus sp.]|nr:hypothetical protein [Fimbriiglobus sp.]